MPAFTDNLTSGTWAVQCANGQYIGFDPLQTDPSGNPYAIGVPTRQSAAFVTFTNTQVVSPTNVAVTISTGAAAGMRYLAANPAGACVFATTPASFNAVLVRSTQLQFGQNVTPTGGQFMTLDPAANRLSLVSGAFGVNSRFGLSKPLPSAAVLWTSQLAKSAIGTPYVYNGAVYASDKNTLLTCTDMLNGKLLWESGESASATCEVEVNYAQSLAFVGDANAVLHAVPLRGGGDVWQFQASAQVYARPGAYVNTVYVPSSDGVLYALSTADGTSRWRFPATGNVTGIFTSPVQTGGTVYFGAWDGNLYAIDAATGTAKWNYAAGNNVNGGIATDSDAVYFGTDGNRVAAIAQADGSESWTYPTNGIVSATPLVSSGNLYFGSLAGDFVCLAAATGTVVWQKNLGNPIAASAQGADGVVYVDTLDGTAFALDATTGATLARYTFGSTATGSPVLFSGALYVAAAGRTSALAAGLVQGFNPANVMALLMLSGWSDSKNGAAPVIPSLPSGWTSVDKFAPAANTFGSGAVTTLTLPGTDESVVAVTLGIDPNAFLVSIDTTANGLVALPASIAGTGAPPGITVNTSVLGAYQAIRAALLSAVSQAARGVVRVAGLGGGAAVATLAALDLSVTAGKTGMPTVTALELVTFGSPAIGNQAFATYFGTSVPNCTRIVNVTDSMPSLLPAALGYVPVGKQCTIGAEGVTTSPSIDATSFNGYRVSLVGR